jgi:tetratricopeptide (TPR) repeat protein
MTLLERVREWLTHPQPSEGTPEHDLWLARRELSKKQKLEHGAFHLGRFALARPEAPELVEMIHAYLDATGGDLERLVRPADGKLYDLPQAAIAVWGMQTKGRLDEALCLLLELTEAEDSNACLAAWAALWITDERNAAAISDSTANRIMAAVGMRLPEWGDQTSDEIERAAEWSRLAHLLREKLFASGDGVMAFASTLRHAGRFDEVLQILKEETDRAPSWHAWCARGLVLKVTRQTAEAVEVFDRATECDPANLAGWLEAGDALTDLLRWEDARQRYDSVLKIQPDHAWAAPSADWCAWMAKQDEAALASLIETAEAGNHRASALTLKTGWTATIPEPQEACLHFVLTAKPGDRMQQMASSCMEAPSGHSIIRLWAGPDVLIDAPEPEHGEGDPRECIESVRWPLWRYQRTRAEPALPSPTGAWLTQIDHVLSLPWSPSVIWEECGRMALKCQGEKMLEDLLAHAVHFASPPDQPECDWLAYTLHLRRTQHIVAWIAAQAEVGSAWQNSMRRDALRSLILGPQDWTTCAGITAACRLSKTDPSCADELHGMFEKLWAHRPRGHWEWEAALMDLWPSVPGVTCATLSKIQQARQEMAQID